MIPVSNEYRRQLIAGNRNWLIKVDMTLADGTILNLTNEHIWDNGIVLDEATSSDDTFDIGAAIVGSLKVVINNINGNFSLYDFYDARLVLWLGVTGDVDEYDVQRYYRIGFYVVDTPTYNGSLITLNCLDNMTWFDVPFEEVTGITYPTTAGDLVNDICSYVGVFLANPSFPNYTTVIEAAPEQKLNCREVIQYVAQMCCCYCKIDRAGELYLWWYDKNAIIGLTNYDGGSFSTTTTPYSDGCDLDGGHFNPWDGDSADGGTFQDLLDGAWISSNFEIEVSTDDVVVTGCRVRNTTKKDDSYDELWVDPVVEQDHERYVLVVENNPFINATNAATLANVIGSTLAGLPIRGFTSTTLADFSYETGDMATIVDFRGNRYYSWITHFTFTTNNSENFSCGVESLRKRSEERFSGTVKTLAEANENTTAILSDYDNAQAAMNELAQNALDYKKYEATVSGGLVTWLYNGTTVDTNPPASSTNPYFPSSTVVFKISGDGVFVAQGDDIDPVTGEVLHYSSGYDANSGTAILNMIFAHGVNCDWIHAGTLTLGGNSDVNGLCTVLDANGVQKVRLDNTGLTAIAGSIDGTLTIGANGYLGSTAGNMRGLKVGNGTLGISAAESSSWTALAFGDEARTRSGWSNSCCILWNGGNGNGGFHVISGSPNQGNTGNFSVLKQSSLQFWTNYNLAYYYDTGGGHSGSDKRLKKNIKSFTKTSIRKFFELINPVSFAFKSDNKKHFGIVAQELEEVLNEANLNNDVLIEETPTKDKYKAVAYSEFHGLELAGIKDLYSIVNKQQEEIKLLKAELAELKERVK